MKIRYLALLVLLSAPASRADQIDQYGIPRVSEHIVDFTYDSAVDREIAVGKVLDFTSGKTGSYIRFAWSDDAFSYAAQEIRRELIRHAISPDRIVMSYEDGGYNREQKDVSGIRLYIQNITLRLPECRYAMQSYRYQAYENPECAVSHNRGISLVNPYKMIF